jgi:recombination protein RecA
MKRTIKSEEPLSDQMKRRMNTVQKERPEYDGDFGTVISTGSTLLDLSISGGRVRGGGMPGGILVEAFGPNGSGKTVLLSEIAGDVQRKGGEVKFNDPEARLNQQFCKMFGLKLKTENYHIPDTVTEVFSGVRNWKPEKKKVINGVFADSLAALSTNLEMDKEEGDKMGMRRAKEFSEELRKTCRILTQNNFLMVCSNQVRINTDPMAYQKYTTPGGEAIGFYSSLRLKFDKPEKLTEKRTIHGKEVANVKGVKVSIEVFKSSIWKPYHKATLYILFDYGIDDIRANLQFIKDYTKNTQYCLGDQELSTSMDEAISLIEQDPNLVRSLREEVIDLWEEIEQKFKTERKPKR